MSAPTHVQRELRGGLVAKARREAGLTQNQLGKRVGRPQPWLSEVEHGHVYLRFHGFVVLARAAGAEPAALCTRYLELLVERERLARLQWSAVTSGNTQTSCRRSAETCT